MADTPGGKMWEPVSAASAGADQWLLLAYQNETLVTQLDGHVRPADADSPVPLTSPTSSSTLPGLVVAMLEDLDVNSDSAVLEIGTGTGYSTALLCERLGSAHVVSIETDPSIAAQAAAAIHQAGYEPTLVTGNGLQGYARRAPYDRIIATCSVRHVPRAWIAQGSEAAIILTTVSGWLHGSAYLRLTVGTDGTAVGRFLGKTGNIDASPPRPASITPRCIDDWTARFIAQLAAPRAQWGGKSADGGPMIDYYVHSEAGSIASLTPQEDGPYLVREFGPAAVWTTIENAISAWQEADSPGIERSGSTSHRKARRSTSPARKHLPGAFP
jgi:protein-L-isoaspartate O-methyltransferase